MEYKVGDRVRIIKENNYFKIGTIVEIREVGDTSCRCKGIDNTGRIDSWWINNKFIQIQPYTWEDFLKCPIGTKVTFENGDIFVKSEEDCFDNGTVNHTYLEMKDINEGEDIEYDYKKIIKIEEPTYTTVYEPNEVEEMTMEEVCKALGKQIKIVKEKSND